MTLLITILLQVAGGLGMFLYGMDKMSKSIQEIAGDRLREIIHKMTLSPFRGILVGTLITAVIQSSSITTVMVVGFVNATLMTLRQAITIILGANIGTTITGWLLVFKITKYGLPIMGIGALVFLFSKDDMKKKKAMIFIGLGMIFLGLSFMKDGMAPLKDMPNFISFFNMFSAESYRGVLLSALTGAALTSVLQSSSATVGITMALATQGLIIPTTAVALVLGENVGTTITAYLASIPAGVNAKRVAYAHIFIKLIGVSFIMPFFYIYANFIGKISPPEKNISEYIAISHTLFNIGNALIFIPFINIFIKFLGKIGKEEEEKKLYTEEMLYRLPLAVLEKSKMQVIQMEEKFIEDIKTFKKLLDSKISPEYVKTIFEGESYQDLKKAMIDTDLTGLLNASNSKDVLNEARVLMRLADIMESLGDYGASLGKIYTKILNNQVLLSKELREEIGEFHDEIIISLKNLKEVTLQPDAEKIEIQKKTCHSLNERLMFVDPLEKRTYPEHVTMEILAKYRRINRHILSMLESLKSNLELKNLNNL